MIPTVETIEYAIARTESQIRLNKFRQQMAQEDFDREHAAGHWSQLSGRDGIVTGLIIAESLLRDDLKELQRIKLAVIQTNT